MILAVIEAMSWLIGSYSYQHYISSVKLKRSTGCKLQGRTDIPVIYAMPCVQIELIRIYKLTAIVLS